MDDDRILWSLKRRGRNYEQIAAITGLTEEEVRGRMKLPRADKIHGDPNELLIQLMASAIRMTWSQEERSRRLMLPDCGVFYGSPVSLDVPLPSRN